MKRALLLVLAVAVTWPVTAHYRAKWRLADYKRRLQAAGERLTFAQLIPNPRTDGPNGAWSLQTASGRLNSAELTNLPPTMKWVAPGRAIVSWREDPLPTIDSSNVWPALSQAVNRQRETVTEIRAALESPVLSFDLNYQQGFSLPLPHLAPLKGAAQWLAATMLVELHQGHPTNAWENLRALTALMQRFRNEPLVISELVRVAIGQIALNATWEALESTGWPDEQLAENQAAWQSVDLLTQADSALAMEQLLGEQAFAQWRRSYASIGFMNGSGGPASSGLTELAEMGKELVHDPGEGLKSLARRYPRYWNWKWWQSYEDELANIQACQAGIRAMRTAREEQALGPALKQLDQDLACVRRAHPNAGYWPCYSLLDDRSRRFSSRIRALEIQRALVVTALALKRYQLGHGAYPPELGALAPAFLSAAPRDPIDGKPLRYQLKPDGSFLLYSVGEDGEDNGGDATPTEAPTTANKRWWQARDAVWPQPATPEEVNSYFAKLALDRKKYQEAQAASLSVLTVADAEFRKRYGLPPLPASPSAVTNDPGISRSGSGQTNSGANSIR